MRIGIVYYSRTGNTKHVARLLEQKLKENKQHVDVIEIEHAKRPGLFGAGRAARKQKELPIKNTAANLKEYDMVLVGSPTWAGRPSPYIRSFFTKATSFEGKAAGVFITGGGPGEDNVKNSESLKEYLGSIGLKPVNYTLNLQMKKETGLVVPDSLKNSSGKKIYIDLSLRILSSIGGCVDQSELTD